MKTSINPDQLLNQMQQLNKLAKAGSGQAVGNGAGAVSNSGAEFGKLLGNAIDSVNSQQMEAGKLSNQIEMGDGGVSLVKAMIASQKANVAFQATLQVRNRVVSAYQDIMNMPI